MLKTHLVFLLLAVSPIFAWAQERVAGDHIKVRVLAPVSFSTMTETLVGVYFEPDEHWHVYWKNPGDSGAAPKFEITSQNADTGPILWPAPKRLPVAHLTNLGYVGPVAYLFSVKPKAEGKVRVNLSLEWLVCKEECVPGFGQLSIERPAFEGATKWKGVDEKILRQFASRLPLPGDSAPFKIHKVASLEGVVKVYVKMNDDNDFDRLDLFPVNGESILPSKPEKGEGEFSFKKTSVTLPSTLQFVGTLDENAWEFVDLPVTAKDSGTPLWILILSAIVGGFLLNLMPCVFPVISIKAFSLLKTQSAERIRDCLLYALGVLTTFSALGAVFLILRNAGAAIGWGFQLQSPLVIFLLIVLFYFMAMNFLGFFEFGTSTMNVAGRFSKKSSSFGTGVLSVFVAAPCTGPFMGTALGAAVTLPPFSALMIFLSLGMGLSLPFIIFGLFPRSLSWLPKPGGWMETLKQFFAFPLLATVVWLLWVLGSQTQTQGWLLSSCALLVLSFGLWLQKRTTYKRFAGFFLMGVIAWFGIKIYHLNIEAGAPVRSAWASYDHAELSKARQRKQAVFVDFTAAWCITCQVNKQAVLDTAAGQELFRKHNVYLMRADWSRYDPKITDALSALGRNSVPVYAFYPSDGSSPKLLPQLLTLSMVSDVLEKGDRK